MSMTAERGNVISSLNYFNISSGKSSNMAGLSPYTEMETQQLTRYPVVDRTESFARNAQLSYCNGDKKRGRMTKCHKTGQVLVVENERMRYVRGTLLGKGGFAHVYLLTTDDESCSQFAGKIINKTSIKKAEKKDKIAREIDIQRRMKHENVVRFYNFFEDDEHVFIVMEYCGNTTLSKILRARKCLTEPEIRYYLRQLLAGTEYIHNLNIVHRDLKLSNLFITENMHLKIGDFGLSAHVTFPDDKKESICGTPNYIAPEVIRKTGHSFPVDVWAIGCIVYALLSGRPPFETDRLKDTYKLIIVCKYVEPSTASANVRHLVSSCLRVNPMLRPTIDNLKESPFLLQGFTPAALPATAASSLPLELQNTRGSESVGDHVPITGMEYLINNIDERIISAEGGKSLPEFPTCTSICSQLLANLTSVCDKLEGMCCHSNPKSRSIEDFVWITKWVDYSHKYGFGFQLSNNVYGASFKDGFSIAVNGKQSHVGLMDPADKTTLVCQTKQLMSTYDSQYQVMKYFVKYMNDTLMRGGDAEEQSKVINCLSETFMLRWQRCKDSIIMCLSTGTVQINWLGDHTKLAIEKGANGYRVMYINKKRESSVFRMSDIAKYGSTSEVRLRMQYMSHALRTLLNTPASQ